MISRPDSRSNHGTYGHPRSQRHRKMRDYDSDTGYRSEQEVMKFRRQQQQMFQRSDSNYGEIVPVANKGRRRDGYSSDLEGYSRRTLGYHDPHALETHSNSSQDGSQCHRSYSNSRSPSKQSAAVKNDELYELNPMNPSINHHPSSPSPLQSRNVTDQSTPLIQNQQRSNEHEWRQEMIPLTNQIADVTLTERENRYMVRIKFQCS